MPKILEKRTLTPVTKLYRLDAPMIAAAAEPGQFVIVRVRRPSRGSSSSFGFAKGASASP